MSFQVIRRVFFCRRLLVLCVVVGMGLMLLNVVGDVVSPRDPQVYQEPRNFLIGDTNAVLTAEEFWSQAKPRANENNRDYAIRVTHLVNDGLAFLQVGAHAEIDKYNWRVAFWNNYLLWGSRRGLFLCRWARGTESWSSRGQTYRYVFSDYHHAIERGVGLCGQQTVVLMGLLKEQGIATHFVDYSYHSMVEAEVEPGVWWVLDPTLDTVLAYDVATLCKQPGLIRSACLSQGRNGEVVEILEASFSGVPCLPTCLNAVKDAHGPYHYYFEYASYYLIWVIPALMIATGIIGLQLRGNDGNSVPDCPLIPPQPRRSL